jgi:hypothetical protein
MRRCPHARAQSGLRTLHVVVDLLADRLRASDRPMPTEVIALSEHALGEYASEPQGGIADYRWEKIARAATTGGQVA